MPSDSPSSLELQHVLMVMEHLTQWLVRSGIGYTEFSAALKPIFYQQAEQELQRIGQKATISSISLLAGLHRKDVSAFKLAQENGQQLTQAKISEPINVPSRVIGLWLAEGLAPSMPFSSQNGLNFEDLVKRISSERHPRSVCNELIRLDIVREEDGQVILQQRHFIPDGAAQEARSILSQNVKMHLAAGLHNIYGSDQTPFLEQAVRADGLTTESVEILQKACLELWEKLSIHILKMAIERCEIDNDKADATKKFAFGAYQYDE